MKRARHRARRAAGIVLLVTAGSAAAQSHWEKFRDEFLHVVNHGDKRLRLDYENDVFFGIDRNYTSGVRLTYKAVSPDPAVLEEGALAPLFPGQDDIERHRARLVCATPGAPVCLISTYGVVLGQNLYTPSDIRLPSSRIGPVERPYAAWLYVGFYRELYASDERYWRYGLDIGCIGPCARGRQVQTWIHEHVTHSPLPQGWDSQVRNELGLVLRYEYGARPWSGPLDREMARGLAWELRPRVSFGLGNVQTYAGAGVMLRVGRLAPAYRTQRLDNRRIDARAGTDTRADPRQHAAADTVGRADATPATGPEPGASAGGFEWYGFGRAYAGAMAYNALLQGGLFDRSSPRVAAARPLTVEAEAGIGVGSGAWAFTFSLLHKREWESGGRSFVERYGRIALEMPF